MAFTYSSGIRSAGCGLRFTRTAMHTNSYSSKRPHKTTEAKYPDNQKIASPLDGMHCAPLCYDLLRERDNGW